MESQITVYKQGKTWHAELNGCQGKGTTEMAAINRAHKKMMEKEKGK